MTKSGREIMEIFEAFDLTGTAWSAAQLAGCDAKTVARYVAVREAGGDPLAKTSRPRLIDGFMPKVEELVDRSKGKIRADVAHRKLVAMGYRGSERSTRRAVAEVKAGLAGGPAQALPAVGARAGDVAAVGLGRRAADQGAEDAAVRAWLAWSRFRVVIPVWDQQLGTLTWCIDQALRAVGGAPTYLLTDNARTVTMDHVAGIPVRHPEMVALGRHYGCKVETCVPFDPESKGGVEATVKIAKADLVPSEANLLPPMAASRSWRRPAGSSAAGSTAGCTGRPPRSRRTGWPPSGRCCTRCPPSRTRWRSARSGWSGRPDDPVRVGPLLHPARPRRDAGVVPGRRGGAGDHRPHRPGAAEITRHRLSVPGSPSICDEHYPDHPGGNGPRQPRPRPRTEAEAAFLAIGDGAQRWLAEAAASGAPGSGPRWPGRSSWPRGRRGPGRRGAGAGGDRGPVRRRRPGLDHRPPGRRAGDRRGRDRR